MQLAALVISGIAAIVSAISLGLSHRAKKRADDAYWRDTRAELRPRALQGPMLRDGKPPECKWLWSLANGGKSAALDVQVSALWHDERNDTGAKVMPWEREPPLGFCASSSQRWVADVLPPCEGLYFDLRYIVDDAGGDLVISWVEIRGERDARIIDTYRVTRRRIASESAGPDAYAYDLGPRRRQITL